MGGLRGAWARAGTGDLPLERAFPFQVFSPGAAALTLGFTPSPSPGPGALLLTPLANLSFFGKKWTRSIPHSWFLPLAEDVGFTLASVQASMPLTPSIPYLRVLPLTCSLEGRDVIHTGEMQKSAKENTRSSLVGSTAWAFPKRTRCSLREAQTCKRRAARRLRAATRASLAAPPPVFWRGRPRARKRSSAGSHAGSPPGGHRPEPGLVLLTRRLKVGASHAVLNSDDGVNAFPSHSALLSHALRRETRGLGSQNCRGVLFSKMFLFYKVRKLKQRGVSHFVDALK